jgi:hypothetical protein
MVMPAFQLVCVWRGVPCTVYRVPEQQQAAASANVVLSHGWIHVGDAVCVWCVCLCERESLFRLVVVVVVAGC